MKNKKIPKKVKMVFFALLGAGIGSFLAVYFVLFSGIFPEIRDMWVTTAMTTMNHKWLATAFLSDETINEIMERNTVNDDGYQTNTNLVKIETTTEPTTKPQDIFEDITEATTEAPTEPIDPYIEEGYELLEEGLYKKEVKGDTWYGYIMLVTDPSRVHLTDTKNQHSVGQTVMQMVTQNDAIAGINGGGFQDGPNYDSNGGNPAGLLIIDGEVVNPLEDYGQKYSVIGFNEDNVFVMGKMTMQEALDNKIKYCVDFKPFLVVNGEKVIKEGTGGWGIAPRTALGQRSTGEVLFFCVDGRQVHSIGVDLVVLQDTLYDEGCVNVGMMDGGSSTVMIYNGEFVNKPSLGYERYINNCWIIK